MEEWAQGGVVCGVGAWVHACSAVLGGAWEVGWSGEPGLPWRDTWMGVDVVGGYPLVRGPSEGTRVVNRCFLLDG